MQQDPALSTTALAYRVGGTAHLEGMARAHRGRTRSGEASRARRTQDPQGKRLVQEQLASRLAYLDARWAQATCTLDRRARTLSLSGGEAQRAGLTTALGAALTGTLFVLDEPTVGLHASDVPALAQVMRELAGAGNTVLVVEHDESLVRAADRVVELGSGAGLHGGRVLSTGRPRGCGSAGSCPPGGRGSGGASWSSARRGGLAGTWCCAGCARTTLLLAARRDPPGGCCAR